jgi:small basic protein
MLYLLTSFALGIVAGFFLPFSIPITLGKYLSVAVLAALDSILGGGKAVFRKRFNISLFVSGFVSNTFLAFLLTYIGDRLGVELYLAAIITFGVRIFQNLSILRVYFFQRFSTDHQQGFSKPPLE